MMLIKQLLFIIAISILPVLLFGQEKDSLQEEDPYYEYQSSERDKYYEQIRELFNHPLPSREDVLAFSSPYCSVQEIDNYSVYVDSIIQRTPYYDSIIKIEKTLSAEVSFSLFMQREKIAGVCKTDIIKHEKRGTLEVFIYTDYKYSSIFSGGADIWIALSKDNGQSWEHYFTGTYNKQPVCLKWYSALPLITSDNTIQIEAALLQQTKSFALPCGFPEYEVIKDGIIVTFDINTLTKDSDDDGLTDIVEEKFSTNPNCKDTNSNGIPDNIDLNPCYNIPRTDQTEIFETLINSEFAPIDWEDMDRIMELPDSLRSIESAKQWEWKDISSDISNNIYANDSTKTIVIVTDDPNIKAIQPKYVRVIIISTDDYKKDSKNRFKTDLDMLSIDPTFKVDGHKDLYIIQSSYQSWGQTYLVRKAKNSWQIKLISMYII